MLSKDRTSFATLILRLICICMPPYPMLRRHASENILILPTPCHYRTFYRFKPGSSPNYLRTHVIIVNVACGPKTTRVLPRNGFGT